MENSSGAFLFLLGISLTFKASICPISNELFCNTVKPV